jgi:hypothetical protein
MSDEWDLKICCMGAGYVGGPTMAVIAKRCPKVRLTREEKGTKAATVAAVICIGPYGPISGRQIGGQFAWEQEHPVVVIDSAQ